MYFPKDAGFENSSNTPKAGFHYAPRRKANALVVQTSQIPKSEAYFFARASYYTMRDQVDYDGEYLFRK